MLFNSLDFAIFLPIVFVGYWFVFNRNLRIQNLFLFVSSYFFYAYWDYRFLLLLFFSSMVDYLVGVGLARSENRSRRKILLFVSLSVNLGILGLFKYYNFFIESFVEAFSFFGTSFEPQRLSIILPVGISFYTFQTLGYSIDVYRKEFQPTKDILSFFAFVSFFPQLVAGPIERAKDLLVQFYRERTFNYPQAVDGLRQALWGLFKKVVIADNAARYVNVIFSNYFEFSGLVLSVGTFLFAFQIYCDFSGYSDIAIGTARLFGFRLTRNFNYPYFSRDIAEFWRRWHITLTKWFKDYVYIPLGGNRGGISAKIRNTLAVFILSGFWHGANWKFIFWGFINAVCFLPLLMSGRNRVNLGPVSSGKIIPGIKEISGILGTFLFTLIAWVFFRAEDIVHAFKYLAKMLYFKNFIDLSPCPILSYKKVAFLIIVIFIFVIIEWLQRDKAHALEIETYKLSRFLKWSIYSFLIFLTGMFARVQTTPFIYFQF